VSAVATGKGVNEGAVQFVVERIIRVKRQNNIVACRVDPAMVWEQPLPQGQRGAVENTDLQQILRTRSHQNTQRLMRQS
jgi:hypothetical protein